MSRRVIFQNLVHEHPIRVQDEAEYGHEEEEEEKEAEPDTVNESLAREIARKRLTLENRRQRRRKKAYGSVWWRYLNVRLQLRVLISSSKNVVILFMGAFVLIGLWAFLVFGKPDSPSFWSDIDSRWGGSLNDSTSILCELPKPNAFTRQPASGFASITYAIAGWFMLWMWFLDEKQSLTFEARFGNLPASLIIRRCYWSALLGMSMLLLSTLVWLRHATFSNIGKRLETTGYWTVLLAFSTCSVTRLIDSPRKLRTREWTVISKIITFIFIFTTCAVDVAFGIRLEALRQPGVPEIVFGTLAGLALAAVLVHWRMHRISIESEMWLLFFGMIVFVGGFLFAHYDAALCLHPSIFAQPYAFWHVCNSLAALLFYLFLRADLWVKGDGAEFAPSIRPFIWLKTVALVLVGYVREVCKGLQATGAMRKERKEKRITLLRQAAIEPQDDIQLGGEDEEESAAHPQGNGASSTTRRLATARSMKSIASVWTPELGFTAKQIRVAEVFCGLVITGFVIYVIYLALGPKST